jgi:hypothetical protein
MAGRRVDGSTAGRVRATWAWTRSKLLERHAATSPSMSPAGTTCRSLPLSPSPSPYSLAVLPALFGHHLPLPLPRSPALSHSPGPNSRHGPHHQPERSSCPPTRALLPAASRRLPRLPGPRLYLPAPSFIRVSFLRLVYCPQPPGACPGPRRPAPPRTPPAATGLPGRARSLQMLPGNLRGWLGDEDVRGWLAQQAAGGRAGAGGGGGGGRSGGGGRRTAAALVTAAAEMDDPWRR